MKNTDKQELLNILINTNIEDINDEILKLNDFKIMVTIKETKEEINLNKYNGFDKLKYISIISNIDYDLNFKTTILMILLSRIENKDISKYIEDYWK